MRHIFYSKCIFGGFCMDKSKKIIGFDSHFDHAALEEAIGELAYRYDFIDVSTLAYTIMGKSIPIITLGKGKKSVLYVGAHHGMEWISSALLIRFINEYCEEYKRAGTLFGVSTRFLDMTRKIYVIPMLNPDGVEYSIHGICSDHVLYDRLVKMNGGSKDFTKWQANARGVDLNHNYNSGFEEYKLIERELGIFGGSRTRFSGENSESEPETSALCNFVRIQAPEMALTFHSQGEEIYYTSGGRCAKNSLSVGKVLSRLCGYKLSLPEGAAAYGGFTDWFIEEFDKPSFTIECGRGENPLPFSDLDEIYHRLRQMLFLAPTLI